MTVAFDVQDNPVLVKLRDKLTLDISGVLLMSLWLSCSVEFAHR